MIDTDFEDIRRPDVVEYIKQRYGTVYNIRTFGYLGASGAVQKAAMVLKMSPKEASTLSKGLENIDDIQGHDELKDIAKHFENRLYSFGTHASAIMVFDEPIESFCSIEKQGDDFVVSYDAHVLESFGCLKLDILGLRNLTVVHDTMRLLDSPPDIYNLPMDDSKVFQRYADGNTSGLFQVESQLMTQYSKKMNVDNFNDIPALISLVRPGPLDSGMAQQYIDGKNGDAPEILDERLVPIMGNTYQVLVYQEQLMRIAREIGGYSLGESDALRKIVGRKELDKIGAACDEFIVRATDNGTDPEVAKVLAKVMQACGRYIFNLSHAVSYGMMSYITGYLAVHYPKEYFCSILNSVITKQDKTIPYINELHRLNITILPPDLSIGNLQWVIEGDAIRVGLTYISGIGKNITTDTTDTFEAIVASNSKSVVIPLIKSGALDYLGKPRGYLMSAFQSTQDSLKRIKQCNEKIAEYTAKNDKRAQTMLAKWQENLRIAQEEQSFTVESFNEVAAECDVLSFSFKEIPKVKLGKVESIFKKNDKNGNEMAWILMDTIFGKYRCAVFSKGWGSISSYVKQGESYEFIVNNDILEEIKIGNNVIETNKRRHNYR